MKIETYENTISVPEFVRDFVRVEEFLSYCRACGCYENVWSCPPFSFDPVKDVWGRFSRLNVVGKRLFLEEEEKSDWEKLLTDVKSRLTDVLMKKEAEVSGSLSLSAGNCRICGKGNCTRPIGLPCRFPEKMRYSIEALGGDVGFIAKRLLGVELQWAKNGEIPNHFMLIGGILLP